MTELRLAEIFTHGQAIDIFERVQLIFLNYRRTCENKTEIYVQQTTNTKPVVKAQNGVE